MSELEEQPSSKRPKEPSSAGLKALLHSSFARAQALLDVAITRVPSVKSALAVAAIAAAAFVAKSFHSDLPTAFIAVLGTIILMVTFRLFEIGSSKGRVIGPAAVVLYYSYVAIAIAIPILLISAVLFSWPVDLSSLLPRGDAFVPEEKSSSPAGRLEPRSVSDVTDASAPVAHANAVDSVPAPRSAPSKPRDRVATLPHPAASSFPESAREQALAEQSSELPLCPNGRPTPGREPDDFIVECLCGDVRVEAATTAENGERARALVRPTLKAKCSAVSSRK